MKYIIKNSDLFLNGKLLAEGTEIDLAEEQIKGLEDFLIPISNENGSVKIEDTQKKINTKGNKK